MYVLRYTVIYRGRTVEVFLSCGRGYPSHVAALFLTDCLWLVPGTIDLEALA
jgi:hypothetical protein